MYGYVCICQSKIQDRYYYLQDPTVSMSIVILTVLPSAYFAKATGFFLPRVRRTTNAPSPALLFAALCPELDIPCLWSIIATLKTNDRFKNGIPWNFLSFYHLCSFHGSFHYLALHYISIWLFFCPNWMQTPWEQDFICFIHRWVPDHEAVTGIQ